MYRSRNQYSSSNRNSSRNSNNRGYRGGNRNNSNRFAKRKINSFDPSTLVSKAPKSTTKPEYKAKYSFADFDIDNKLKQNILDRGYGDPTPIQDQIIPHLLEEKDVVGIASTGTGKTAAFLIPLINKIYKQRSEKVLIMAPTRELAEQIENEFKLFANGMRLYSCLCIGGAPINRQIRSLRRHPNFVIGTPGRLIDLEKRNEIKFSAFSSIVLDEVDQMFDMGFIHDMKYVIAKLPKKRHSLFFSATLPGKLDGIVNSFLSDPVKVQTESQKASANVDQDIVKVAGKSKVDLLHDLLIKKEFEKVLVFGPNQVWAR